jgi:hypothetical protein
LFFLPCKDSGFLAVKYLSERGEKGNFTGSVTYTYGIISVSAVPLNMSGGRRSAIPAVDGKCGENARLSLSRTFIRDSAAS